VGAVTATSVKVAEIVVTRLYDGDDDGCGIGR
jgi:hypothetical protein